MNESKHDLPNCVQGNSFNNKRVAFYARVSTEEQREGHTIDSQIAELKRFASEKQWEIADVYKDDGWSGSLLARPNLDRLRDDASKELFTFVLINDVDRLARDVTHLGVIKRDLERHGVQVVFRKLPTEKSPTYNLMVNILGSFAEFEREMITDRLRRGKRHKVEVRKLFVGSIPPYGYRYIRKDRAANGEGTFELNPEEAATVKQMYKWVAAEGLSARKVLSRLDKMHVPPRKGSKNWAKSSVLRILRSEIYVGVWHYYKHESCVPTNPTNTSKYKKTLKSSRKLRSRSEWVRVDLEESLRIVSRQQWDRVQVQLDQNRAFSPRNERHFYLLKGLVRCGGCGARYVGDPCHGRFYYRCLRRCKKIPVIQESHLSSVVWTAVEKAILNPELIAHQIPKLSEQRFEKTSETVSEVATTGHALHQIQREENRLIEAYRTGILSSSQLGQELEKVNIRKSVFDKRKTQLSSFAQQVSPPAIRRSIAEYCGEAAQRMRSFGPEERQRFLRHLIGEILFDGSSVRIRGVIPLRQDGVIRDEPPEAIPGSGAEGDIANTTRTDDGRNPGSIAATTSQEDGRNPGGIAGTTREDYGRNVTSIFQAFSEEQDNSRCFNFELIEPIHSTQTD